MNWLRRHKLGATITAVLTALGASIVFITPLLTPLFGDNIAGRAWERLSVRPRGNETTPIIKKEREGLIETKARVPRVELINTDAVCRGCPSDHASFVFLFHNHGPRSATIKNPKINVQDIRAVTPKFREQHCKEADALLHQWCNVDCNVDELRIGSVVELPFVIEIPNQADRPIAVCFRFKSQNGQDFSELLLRATLVIQLDDGEITEDIEISGPSDSAVLSGPLHSAY